MSLIDLSNTQFEISARMEDGDFGHLTDTQKNEVAAFFENLSKGFQSGDIKDTSLQLNDEKLMNALRHAAESTELVDVEYDYKTQLLSVKKKDTAPDGNRGGPAPTLGG